ncbi:bleomycin resistance family protein, partial [Elizabethkingia miricola]|nr:bleomycin resistance family protein [Elizabethkingia miricola]
CYNIEDFPWQMREFAIYDNNGYILQFGQDVETLK